MDQLATSKLKYKNLKIISHGREQQMKLTI